MRSLVAIVTASCIAGASVAQPAPWYLWASKLNGKTTCQQTSPGNGWKRVDGPFRDARCKQPVHAPKPR